MEPANEYQRTFEETDEMFRTETGCRAYIRRRSKALLFHRLARQAVVVGPAAVPSFTANLRQGRDGDTLFAIMHLTVFLPALALHSYHNILFLIFEVSRPTLLRQ